MDTLRQALLRGFVLEHAFRLFKETSEATRPRPQTAGLLLPVTGALDHTSLVDKLDVEEMRPLLEAKLQPWRMRATLTFAGLYQLTYEMIRQVVLDQVKNFYLRGFDESGLAYDTAAYKENVLDRDPKSRLRGSLL